MECLDENQVVALLNGSGDEKLTNDIERHIDRCLTCRLFVAEALRGLGAGSSPKEIGRFTVLRVIGVGASAVVYAAQDNQLGRQVAIKMLHVIDEVGDWSRDGDSASSRRLARLRGSRIPTSSVCTRWASMADIRSSRWSSSTARTSARGFIAA